ncbi:MAG: Stp1/IreP family PP2C-type Ser/Thr phosphatase [Defluviitaleaceae bacterium]|nr:Stp1/IreP family PP2C-type Ser/Thr phosphatase [Defluviitaleaceae bacterium]
MYASGLTDVGMTRSQNQDAIFVSTEPVGPLPNLFIVADGMGGHNAGDVASKQAVELASGYIRDFPAAEFVQPDNFLDLMVNAAQHASGLIYAESEKDENMKGMGTTLTACVVEGGKAIIAHVGDSRAYTVSEEKITQLTTDHTYVDELKQAGQLSVEEARNHPKRHVLTRVLGVPGHCQIDGYSVELSGVETILLCSDGLSNMLDDEILQKIIVSEGHAEYRIKKLIKEANNKGGNDNISAILIDLGR